MVFWKFFYVITAVALIGAVALAFLGANPGGHTTTASSHQPAVAVPAAPVEQPRRSRFNMN